MDRRTGTTSGPKTTAGYDSRALNEEKMKLAQKKAVRAPSKRLWANGQGSPIAELLDVKPDFKVLVVDDNRPIRNLVRSILLAFGVPHVTEAEDGRDAIRQIQSDVPDLIVTDMEMSPMSGLELIQRIRQNPRSPDPDIPIVVMTSYTEKRRIMEIRNAGLTEVMAKPVTPKLLIRNILTAMEHRKPPIKDRSDTQDARAETQPEEDEEAREEADYFYI